MSAAIERHIEAVRNLEALESAETRLNALIEAARYPGDDEGLFERQLMSLLIQRAMMRRDELHAKLYGRAG